MLPESANTKYQVLIYNRIDADSGQPIFIWAHCPDMIKLNFRSNWGSPLSDVFQSKLVEAGADFLENIPRMAGYNIGDQLLSAQLWRGTEAPEFSMALEFYAEDDPVSDVVTRVADLCRLVLPRQIGPGLMTVPGPNVYRRIAARLQQFGKDNGVAIGSDVGRGFQTSILFGERLYFDDVVFSNVNVGVPAAFDESGYATYMKCDITFRQFLTPFEGDIDQIFGITTTHE